MDIDHIVIDIVTDILAVGIELAVEIGGIFLDGGLAQLEQDVLGEEEEEESYQDMEVAWCKDQ